MKQFISKLAPIIKEYLEHRNVLGYSNIHEKFLARFDAYCHEYHSDLETLTKESVRGWVNHEISQGRGRMHSRVASVRNLARYMGNGAYILPETTAVKAPKNSMPYIMTDDELSRFFVAVDNMKEHKFSNTKHISLKLMIPTLFRLIYTCGLRPAEGRLIKRNNINFITGEILIEKTKGHKGHKERIIVMSDDMLKQCRKYDIIRAISNPQNEYFFVRPDGVPVNHQQLDAHFKRCWRQANSDIPSNMLPKLNLYDLRHRFASTVLQKWINEKRDLYAMLPYLRAYMGHEEFSSTAYYIHILPDNLFNSSGIDWSIIDAVNPEVDIWKN